MRTTTIPILLAAAAALALAGAACGGGHQAAAPNATIATTHQAAAQPADPKAVNDELRKEIAETLKGMSEAVFAGNFVKTLTYFDCPPGTDMSGFALVKAFLGDGKYEVQIDPDKLIITVIDADRVLVDSSAAVHLTVDGRPVPDQGGGSLTWRRKDGVWATTDCEAD